MADDFAFGLEARADAAADAASDVAVEDAADPDVEADVGDRVDVVAVAGVVGDVEVEPPPTSLPSSPPPSALHPTPSLLPTAPPPCHL